MPELHNRTLHSFSSEDPQFPAKNLLETKITKKWKCKEAGERSCFVVLKLDKPRVISGIDIGNEKSGFIEVLVGNSQQDPPAFKEILLATSFMTISEARTMDRPNRVRCFPQDGSLIESVAKEKWDLVKIMCTQPFNNRVQYGLSFVTLHTPSEENKKPESLGTQVKADDSAEKKSKFGKYMLKVHSGSDSDDGKNNQPPSAFERWKKSKSDSKDDKPTIKDQVKAKLEDNRRRIRMLPDSSDEDQPKPKPKPNRNRTSGLVYEDEDDEPNEKLQKKLDKDREKKDEEKKSSKLLVRRDDTPSTSKSSSSSHKSPSKSSKPSFLPSSSSKKSPRKDKEPERKSISSSTKKVTYKPFHKLLDGVVLVFSGYVNPERGTIRQKALDMGARYKADWDNSCTHLICAYTKTPKYQQVKGKGKIVGKKWIETCFTEQKKLSWRRFALDREDKDKPESEDEIHNILLQKSPTKRERPGPGSESDEESDEDMVVIDKRVKNGDVNKSEEAQPSTKDESEPIKEDKPIEIDDDVQIQEEKTSVPAPSAMEVSTDEEFTNIDSTDDTQDRKQIYKGKSFYLNDDLPATDVIKLKNQIVEMKGRITERSSKADFIITETGRRLPAGVSGEVLISRWVYECCDLEALIPTTRYKLKQLN